MQIIVKTYAGMEGLLAKELEDLGVQEMQVVKRGIIFQGNNEMLYKCNYLLRTAIRVMVNMKSAEVLDEEALYNLVYKIPWEDYFNVNQTFSVDSVVSSTTFTHSQYVALKTKDAIVDRYRKKFHKRPNVNRLEPDIKINVYISQHNCTISLDSSGASLHKRNYRLHQIAAPLSEVLAAGMLKMAEYDGSQDLMDPMCGSATLGMEAFMLKRNIPAGYFRKHYCFKQWSHFKPEIWETVVADANAKIIHEEVGGKIRCADRQLSAVRKSQENVAEFDEFNPTEFEIYRKDFFKSKSEIPQLLIMNPPYDDKIEVDDILGFYQDIGTTLKHKYIGSTAWIISGHLDALKYVGLKTSKKIDLYNGPIEVKYQKYELYDGSKKHVS